MDPQPRQQRASVVGATRRNAVPASLSSFAVKLRLLHQGSRRMQGLSIVVAPNGGCPQRAETSVDVLASLPATGG